MLNTILGTYNVVHNGFTVFVTEAILHCNSLPGVSNQIRTYLTYRQGSKCRADVIVQDDGRYTVAVGMGERAPLNLNFMGDHDADTRYKALEAHKAALDWVTSPRRPYY